MMETTLDAAAEDIASPAPPTTSAAPPDLLQFETRIAELQAFEEEAAKQGIVTISKSPVSSEQLSLYFYEASNTWSKQSFNRLKECADAGLLIAKGFLMRMYAFGSGMAKQDTVTTNALAKSIVPILQGESAYRRYLQSMQETYPDLIKESDVQELRYVDYLLSSCYHKGLGIESNEVYSYSYALRSAALQYAPAQNYIGYCYEKGVGTDVNLDEALKHYLLAAEQQHAAAQYNLGLYYKNKKAPHFNEKKAFSYFLQSATQNNIDSQYFVGIFYQEGLGVVRSDLEAVQWFRRSADQGCLWSQNSLGRCYKLGLGVEKSFTEGSRWYLLAAQAGYAISQHNVAFCYKCAEGVTRSDRVALYWFECSADRGDKDAQYHAGMYHLHGANPNHYVPPKQQPASQSSTLILENHNFTFFPSWKKLFPVPTTVDNNLQSTHSVEDGKDPESENINAYFLHSDYIPINIPRATMYLEQAHNNGVGQATYYYALCLLHPQYHVYLRDKWRREAISETQAAISLKKKINEGVALLEQIGASSSNPSTTHITQLMAKYLLAEFYYFGHNVQEADVPKAVDILYTIVQYFLNNVNKIFVTNISNNAASNSLSNMYGREKTPAWMELIKNAVVSVSSNMNYYGRMAMSEAFTLLAYSHSQYIGRLTLLAPTCSTVESTPAATPIVPSTTTTAMKREGQLYIPFFQSFRESKVTSGQSVLTPIVNAALAASSLSQALSIPLVTAQEKEQHRRFRELYYFLAYCWRETISTPPNSSGGNSSNPNGGSTQYYYYHWAGVSRGISLSYNPSSNSATIGTSEDSFEYEGKSFKETINTAAKAPVSVGTSTRSATAHIGTETAAAEAAMTSCTTASRDEVDENAGMEVVPAIAPALRRSEINRVSTSLGSEVKEVPRVRELANVRQPLVLKGKADIGLPTLAAKRLAFLQQQFIPSTSVPAIHYNTALKENIASQKDGVLPAADLEDSSQFFVHLIQTLLHEDDTLLDALTGRITPRTPASTYSPFVRHRYGYEQFIPAHLRFSTGDNSSHSSNCNSSGEYTGYGAVCLPLLPTLSVDYSTIPLSSSKSAIRANAKPSSSRKKAFEAQTSTADIVKLLQHVLFAVYLQQQNTQADPKNSHPFFPNLNVPELLHKRDPFLCYNLALSFYHAPPSSSSEHFPAAFSSPVDAITGNLPPPLLIRDRAESFRYFRYAAEGAVFGEDFDYGTSAVADREKIRFVNPYAYFTLGWCYRYGEGVPPLLDTSSTGDGKERRHYSEARRWFLRAAEHERQFQGTNSNETDSDKGIGQQQPVTIVGQAAWELGLMWWKGRGGERSQIEAWYWILRSVIVTASPSSSSRAMAEWRRQAIDWLEAHWIQFWKRHKPDIPSISATVASTSDAKENEGTGMKIAVGKTESEESENAGRTDREDGSDPSTRSAKIRAIFHALRPEDLNWLTVWRQIYLVQWRNLQKEYWRQILNPESKEFAKDGDLDGSSIRYLQETLNQLESELIMMMLHTIYVDNK